MRTTGCCIKRCPNELSQTLIITRFAQTFFIPLFCKRKA
ncbi:hypothetical protein SPAB_00371 [Salmonella enterica subsp. enterica serovar Paratyphi B str. SPB7]|uniref:Uncharacterized protein n=1 Tax=Salmonella paratyphi B (strain ATCC BAA-1250 / SPB7) TaxID=1016998 RepID=A0A6C6YY23_SALPB|nr:hypothetical protein SPAB_00371 [Salmonella enterica subsp. enterica serovar Paratyphi B str. SPB7]